MSSWESTFLKRDLYGMKLQYMIYMIYETNMQLFSTRKLLIQQGTDIVNKFLLHEKSGFEVMIQKNTSE